MRAARRRRVYSSYVGTFTHFTSRGSLFLARGDIIDEGWIQEPLKHLPTLFTTLRQRYLNRPGGYTRVLRIEPLNRNDDQAPSAILELVDGPRDMRFAMTAKTLVRERVGDGGIREITARNVAKVTRFREDGEEELEKAVRRLETMKGLGKEEKEAEEEEEEIAEREPWEPFPRMKQREREKEDEERPLTERERREKRRDGRNPNTGRRDLRRGGGYRQDETV